MSLEDGMYHTFRPWVDKTLFLEELSLGVVAHGWPPCVWVATIADGLRCVNYI